MISKTKLAVIELSNEGCLGNFIGFPQRRMLSNYVTQKSQDPGIKEYVKHIHAMAERIRKMPSTGEQAGSDDKVVYLKYRGVKDMVLIAEKDIGTELESLQDGALGYVIPYHEEGDIHLAEIKAQAVSIAALNITGYMLDMKFKPTKISSLLTTAGQH